MKMLSRRSINPTLSVAIFFICLLYTILLEIHQFSNLAADKLLSCGCGLGHDISSRKDAWKFNT
jgi:hypothetical protein